MCSITITSKTAGEYRCWGSAEQLLLNSCFYRYAKQLLIDSWLVQNLHLSSASVISKFHFASFICCTNNSVFCCFLRCFNPSINDSLHIFHKLIYLKIRETKILPLATHAHKQARSRLHFNEFSRIFDKGSRTTIATATTTIGTATTTTTQAKSHRWVKCWQLIERQSKKRPVCVRVCVCAINNTTKALVSPTRWQSPTIATTQQ